MTETHMKPLDKRARLQELARLLAAVKSRATPRERERTAGGINFFGISGS
jgi:DNA repair ATPase RecN